MRYPRQAKIFRGQLDVAPFAALFFILVLFLVLGSLLHVPGIPVTLSQTARENQARVISVLRSGEIYLGSRSYGLDSLEVLRKDVKSLSNDEHLLVQYDPGTPRELIASLKEITKGRDARFEAVSLGVQLPASTSANGTPGPTVTVAVTANGHLFHENQAVSLDQLRLILQDRVKESKSAYTLVVLADRAVTQQTMIGLMDLARECGFERMVNATRTTPPPRSASAVPEP